MQLHQYLGGIGFVFGAWISDYKIDLASK